MYIYIYVYVHTCIYIFIYTLSLTHTYIHWLNRQVAPFSSSVLPHTISAFIRLYYIFIKYCLYIPCYPSPPL